MNQSKIEIGQPEQEPNNEQKAELLPSAQVSANALVSSRLLSVGDKLYKKHYGSISEVIVIERVTKTQAIGKNDMRFGIELSSFGTARKVGNTDRWSTGSWYVETDELKEELFRAKTVSTLQKFDYSKLETSRLKELLSLLNGC